MRAKGRPKREQTPQREARRMVLRVKGRPKREARRKVH